LLVRGAIFHHEDLPFHDGESKNKFIILLNTPTQNEPCLFVIATSQQKNKPATAGCLKEHAAFFIPEKSTRFQLPTWLVLFPVYECAPMSVCRERGFSHISDLPGNLIDEIIECIFNAVGDDISKHQRKLLQPSVPKGIRQLAEKFNKRR